MSNAVNTNTNSIMILSPEQKKRFQEYLLQKVYKTERNIAILVALTQVSMIFLFLSNKQVNFTNLRTVGYFSLYIFLLVVTIIAIVLYHYLVVNKKYAAFLWLRRIYAFLLCSWVIGITFLEQMKGNGLSVYCYLMPTTAALLLLNPVESGMIFGSTWLGLACMLIGVGKDGGELFGNMVNSIFVMVLTVFISYRYYRSMAMEFCDREIIADQYQEIQKANHMLQQLVHLDQLTQLYNRHYLLEKIYPLFDKYREQNANGMFLMMDIDYFKQYNDHYGHVQGDECLRNISAIVRKMCTAKKASPVRYGGEEFLIIKAAEQPFQALEFAECLLEEIRKANIVRDDVVQGRVTVSVGLWYKALREAKHIELAIKSADDALYQAKSGGRDRIVVAE